MKIIHKIKDENFVLDDGETGGLRVFTSPIEMDDFDDVIRGVLKERQQTLNLSDEAVGKIAFGFMGGKRTKIQAIFVGQGADKYRKRQKLRLTDVINLSEALGMTLQEVLKKAKDSIRES